MKTRLKKNKSEINKIGIVYYLYRLTFNDGSKYYGMTNCIKRRMKQHEAKRKEPFTYTILKELGSKSDILALEAFHILNHYIKDKSTIRNRYIGSFRLRD